MDKTTVTKKLVIEAGIGLRNAIRSFLDEQQFLNSSITLEYTEKKYLFGSNFLIKVTGEETIAQAWCIATKDKVDEWSS